MPAPEHTARSTILSSEGRAELASLKIDRSRQSGGGWGSLWWVLLLVLVAVGASVAPQVLQSLNGVEVSVSSATLIGGAMKPAGSAPELSAAGYVVADRQSTLASKTTGQLMKVNVREAQKVKQGEIIAEVDHSELDATKVQLEADRAESASEIKRLNTVALSLDAELAATKAPLATLEAEIHEMQIMLTDAQRRYERDKAVAESHALPATQVEDRKTEVQMAQAKINTADQRREEIRQKIAVSEAQATSAHAAIPVAQAHEHAVAERINVLNAQLQNCFVYAPYDGVVTEKMAEIGEIVAPISIGGNMARGSIVTVADWNSLQAEVDVAEAYIAQVKPGARTAITVDAFPEKVFPGRVQRILPRANRTKATVEVRIEFLKRDDNVLPDMGVRVKFLPDDAPAGMESGLIKTKIVIPQSALQGAKGSQYVWVVSENIAKKRPVEIGESMGENVEIKNGVVSGEKVVTRGAEKLTEDNQKVKY